MYQGDERLGVFALLLSQALIWIAGRLRRRGSNDDEKDTATVYPDAEGQVRESNRAATITLIDGKLRRICYRHGHHSRQPRRRLPQVTSSPSLETLASPFWIRLVFMIEGDTELPRSTASCSRRSVELLSAWISSSMYAPYAPGALVSPLVELN